MIFRSKEEAQQFLIEVNKVSQVHSIKDKDYKPTEEEMSSFIKSRGSIIPKLKSFRKSQDGKENWRKNRYSMMAGIKKWHKSTDGKRFHRQLGRYNATRDSSGSREKRDKTESYSDSNISNIYETLKALSSLITHMYIEMEYYHSIDERVDLEILIEQSLPVIRRIEDNLLKFNSISDEDLDYLLRMIHPEDLMSELAESFNKALQEVKSIFENQLLVLDSTESGSYLTAFEKTRDAIR